MQWIPLFSLVLQCSSCRGSPLLDPDPPWIPPGSPSGSPSSHTGRARHRKHSMHVFWDITAAICPPRGQQVLRCASAVHGAIRQGTQWPNLKQSTKSSSVPASVMWGSIALSMRGIVRAISDNGRGHAIERPGSCQIIVFAGPFLGRFPGGFQRDGEMQHGVSCWAPFWGPRAAKKPRLAKAMLDLAMRLTRGVGVPVKARFRL